MPLDDTLRIDARFCGPATSGNGGYTAGRLAEFLDGDAEVTLRSPPPIEVALHVEARGAGIALTHGDVLVAEARPVQVVVELPLAVGWDEAQQASKRYPGFEHHQYPSCFVCGPERPLHDGLAIFPGAVSGRGLVAAPFQPGKDLCDEQGLLRKRFVWASLDCPSWYGYAAFHEPVPILLGRLSVHIEARPRAGERCVVHGWLLAREGRKIRAASALFDVQGKALAWAEAIWVVLKPEP